MKKSNFSFLLINFFIIAIVSIVMFQGCGTYSNARKHLEDEPNRDLSISEAQDELSFNMAYKNAEKNISTNNDNLAGYAGIVVNESNYDVQIDVVLLPKEIAQMMIDCESQGNKRQIKKMIKTLKLNNLRVECFVLTPKERKNTTLPPGTYLSQAKWAGKDLGDPSIIVVGVKKHHYKGKETNWFTYYSNSYRY